MESEDLNTHKENISIKKCFVGGLNPNTTKEDLHKIFSKFGQIEKIVLPYDKKKMSVKGYAFVKFKHEESAHAAVNSYEQLFLKGTRLSIKPFMNSRVASKTSKEEQERKLYVSGFPKECTKSEIEHFFSNFGLVEKIIMQHSFKGGKKQFKGFVFLLMKEKESEDEILSRTNIKFKNFTLKVARALSKEKIYNFNREKNKQDNKYAQISLHSGDAMTNKNKNNYFMGQLKPAMDFKNPENELDNFAKTSSIFVLNSAHSEIEREIQRNLEILAYEDERHYKHTIFLKRSYFNEQLSSDEEEE